MTRSSEVPYARYGRSSTRLSSIPEDRAEAERETLYPIHLHEVAERARGQSPGGKSVERVRAGDPLDLHPQRIHVLGIDRRRDARDGLVERLGPERVAR